MSSHIRKMVEFEIPSSFSLAHCAFRDEMCCSLSSKHGIMRVPTQLTMHLKPQARRCHRLYEVGELICQLSLSLRRVTGKLFDLSDCCLR